MKMADAAAVKAQTGYTAGAVPFIGHGLKIIFDKSLLERSYIVGGSGDELATLKIAPGDVIRLSEVAGWIE
jgi:prolyl-tRNA editing enzyme YbaK/EbsC (Cys-tRNA(Pro) deacylase)